MQSNPAYVTESNTLAFIHVERYGGTMIEVIYSKIESKLVQDSIWN